MHLNTAISVKRISKTYPNGKKALINIAFDLYFGQVIGLIGLNGAGKSTLIHILAGVLKQDEGTIHCNIQDSKELAWVSQFSSIDWYLSVIDNVRLGARLGGYQPNQAKARASECLDKVGLLPKSHLQPDVLSGGEQRRMQIARALAQHPRVLILDEPTIGLDPIASKTLMQSLRSLANQGCLVIISSHDLHLIEEEVDRILFLKEGRLIANEDKKNIINRKFWIRIEYSGNLNETLEITLINYNAKILSKKPLEIECYQKVSFSINFFITIALSICLFAIAAVFMKNGEYLPTEI